MYALIQNGKVAKYPYSPREYQLANPNISLPSTPTELQLQELGMHIVAQVDRPADQVGKIVEDLTPRLFNGVWTQVWNVRNAAPLELVQQQTVLIESITVATQKRLDEFASTRGYDNVNSIAKYKDISDEEIAQLPLDQQPLVVKFRTECRYLAVMTASTWAKLYLILDEVRTGVRPTPNSYTDIQGDLPEIAWPV